VVRPNRAFEPAFVVDAQHLRQIDRTVVMESLAEPLAVSLHIAQMYKEYLLL